MFYCPLFNSLRSIVDESRNRFWEYRIRSR